MVQGIFQKEERTDKEGENLKSVNDSTLFKVACHEEGEKKVRRRMGWKL